MCSVIEFEVTIRCGCDLYGNVCCLCYIRGVTEKASDVAMCYAPMLLYLIGRVARATEPSKTAFLWFFCPYCIHIFQLLKLKVPETDTLDTIPVQGSVSKQTAYLEK